MRLLRFLINGSFAAGLLTLIAACTAMAPPARFTSPPPRPEPTFVTDGPGCDRARDIARREPSAKELIPPAPKSLFVPAASQEPLYGATLIMSVRVDTAGRPVPSTAKVVRHDNGVLVPGYKMDITAALEKLAFRPAVLSGCAVEGIATLYYNTRRY
jgi:hypothetical protein